MENININVNHKLVYKYPFSLIKEVNFIINIENDKLRLMVIPYNM